MRYSIFVLLVLFACNRSSTYEETVSKYPEIRPFLHNAQDFRGASDLDKGILFFGYSVAGEKTPLTKVDSIAKAESWDIHQIFDDHRVYVKWEKSFPADDSYDTLKVEYDVISERLNFIWN